MKQRDKGDECFTAREFSELVGVSIRALAQYDREGILIPAISIPKGKRSLRYYSPAQISTAKILRVLWSIGVQSKTIRNFTRERSPESFLRLMDSTMAMLDISMHMIHRARLVVGMNLDLVQEGCRVSEKAISISVMPERRIIMGEPNEYKGKEGYFGAYRKFCIATHKPTLDLSYKIGGYFECMKDFLQNPSRPARFYSLDPSGHDTIENRLYLVGYTRGDYGQTNDLPERMKNFADKNDLIFDGPVYNSYLIDELAVTDPSQYLLQVSAAIADISAMPNQRPLLHNRW